jgi:ABC-type molybdate transport system substrate-binding protein
MLAVSPFLPRTVFRFLLAVGVAACDTSGGRPPGAASSSDSLPDTAEVLAPAAPRFASDGTISILTVGELTPAIRLVADSFSAREAVQVDMDTLPSLGTARALSAMDVTADIVALTDAALVARLLVPGQAAWLLEFARNRLVIAYRDSSRRAATIDSTNWPAVLLRRDTRVGMANPDRSPLGVQTLLVMQLAEKYREEGGLARRLRAAVPDSGIYVSPRSLLLALQEGALDYAWLYESAARRAGLRYLRLPPRSTSGRKANAEGTPRRRSSFRSPALRTRSPSRRPSTPPRCGALRFATP